LGVKLWHENLLDLRSSAEPSSRLDFCVQIPEAYDYYYVQGCRRLADVRPTNIKQRKIFSPKSISWNQEVIKIIQIYNWSFYDLKMIQLPTINHGFLSLSLSFVIQTTLFLQPLTLHNLRWCVFRRIQIFFEEVISTRGGYFKEKKQFEMQKCLTNSGVFLFIVGQHLLN